MSSIDYQTYLQSDNWKWRRIDALIRADHRCQRCGIHGMGVKLQVHHLTYDRLGYERPEDLKVVCEPCHAVEDEEYRTQTAYTRGLDTYATKKYGEDWDLSHDVEDIEEEFDEWIESKHADERDE